MAPRRAAVAAAVLLGHVLLVLGWRTLTGSVDTARQAGAAAQPPLVVHLWTVAPLSSAARTPSPAPEPPRPAARAARAEAGPARPEPPALQVPQAAALPAPVPSPPAATEAQATTEPASAPLRLDLPRAGIAGRAVLPARHPAMDDVRAHSPTPTMASRIAEATSATWTEEPLGDGRIRYRRGGECFISAPSRDGALDSFNQSVAPRPRGAGPC